MVDEEKMLLFAKRLANIEVDEAENGGEIHPPSRFLKCTEYQDRKI